MSGTYFHEEPGKFPTFGTDAEYIAGAQPLDRPSKKELIQHGLCRITSGSLAVGLVVVGGYNAMNAPEKQRIADSEISLTEVYEAADPANNDSVTIVIGGLGQRNGNYAARQLELLADQGRVLELEHDDRKISLEAALRLIDQKIEAEGITNVAFFGLSMGGNVALDLTNRLKEQRPDVTVPRVFTDSTPCNADVVRADMLRDGNLLIDIIANIYDAEYNPLLRAIGEVSLRDHWFMRQEVGRDTLTGAQTVTTRFDLERFFYTVNTVWKYNIVSPDAASTPLVVSQLDYLLQADSEDDIEALGESNDTEQRTVLVLIRAEDSLKDRVVDVDGTEACFERTTDEAHIPFLVIRIPMGHTINDSSVKEYTAMMQQAMPQVDLLVARSALSAQLAQQRAEQQRQNTLAWPNLAQIFQDIDK